MKTLIIQVPDKEIVVLKEVLKKFKAKIIDAESDETDKIPNALTAKVIKDAKKGKGLGEPIKDINSFMSSI